MNTFIVRIWSPGGSPVEPALRGVVERAGTGETITFVGEGQLIDLLTSNVPKPPLETADPG